MPDAVLPTEILFSICQYLNCNRSLPLVSSHFRDITEITYIPTSRDLCKAINDNNLVFLNRILRSPQLNITSSELNDILKTTIIENCHVK